MNMQQKKQGMGRVEPTPATPPPRGRLNRSVELFDADLAKLRENPGQWMIVREKYPTRSGGDVYRARDCQVTVRRDSEGTFTVYARWPT